MKEIRTEEAELARRLFYQMLRIRGVEEAIAGRYSQNKMRCPTHLSIGQEAVAAAIECAVRPTDYAVSSHRAHAHYLGKGGDLKRMLAEIYGKEAGCARGKGGSMHLIDLAVNFVGSTAIVANSIPVGVGLGLAAKLNKSDRLSCIFFGDGAVEEGAFYEAANFAVLKSLPVIFVCENNLYSVYTPLKSRQPEGRSFEQLARGIGLNYAEGDGNDAWDSYHIFKDAADKVRAGEGPYFLLLHTYRWREHCGPNYDDDLGYRSRDEVDHWLKRDPIASFKTRLLNEKVLTPDQVSVFEKKIHTEIEAAFQFAEDAPFPAVETAFEGLYRDTGGGFK